MKVGRLKGLSFAVQVVRRGRGFYASGVDSGGRWRCTGCGRGLEIFRGLQQELGWKGHRHWRRAKVLGLVAYGLIECQRERLKLSFYQCRQRLIAGKLSLDLSPLFGAGGGRVSPDSNPPPLPHFQPLLPYPAVLRATELDTRSFHPTPRHGVAGRQGLARFIWSKHL